MTGDELDDDPDHDAGITAVFKAGVGDWELLNARLCDPAITLTMFEREWIARQLAPQKRGTPKRTDAPLLVWWFENAEGLDRPDAIRRVCKILGKSDKNPEGVTADAVTKALDRAGGKSYDPGAWWHQCARWYRDGERHSSIFPEATRPERPDFAAFLRNRTE